MAPCFFMLNVTPKAPINTSIKTYCLNSNTPSHPSRQVFTQILN